MRLCAICLIAGALIGCSSTPLELPTCEIPKAPAEAQHPLSLPELPVEVSSTETTATFDIAGMMQLKRYRIASETNERVSNLNAKALEARNESINALIECTKYQKVWAEVREEMLQQERFNHSMDNYWHRAIIVLGALAVAL